MIAMKLGWAVLEGICVWLTLYYGSGGALALGAMLLILPLGSLPIHLCLRKRLRVRVEAPAMARKGDEGGVTVWLENPTLLPALRIRCRVTARNQLNGESCTQHVMTWAFPKGQRRASLRLGSEYCGRIRISVEQVKLYDCFGLIGVPCGCTGEAHMTVQPDTFPIRVNLIPNPDSQEDSDSYSQDRPGADLTETFQIREYVPGDSIRQIHWKLSEKTGTLMVREFGLPAENQLLLVFLSDKSLSPEQLDAMLDTLVSVSSELLRQELPHTLLYDGTLHEISDLEDLEQTVHTLLRSAPEIERTAAFLQEHLTLSYAHIALIAANDIPVAEELSQTGCVSILFPDAGALPEIAEAGRVRIHAFRADALRAGTLHFEL